MRGDKCMVNEISVVGYLDYCSVVGFFCGDCGCGMWISGLVFLLVWIGFCCFVLVVGSGIC